MIRKVSLSNYIARVAAQWLIQHTQRLERYSRFCTHYSKRCNITIVTVTFNHSHRIVGTCLVHLCTRFDRSRPLWAELVSLFLVFIKITVHLINCFYDGIRVSN